MNSIELMRQAAAAAGYTIREIDEPPRLQRLLENGAWIAWNPLEYGIDTFKLMSDLKIDICTELQGALGEMVCANRSRITVYEYVSLPQIPREIALSRAIVTLAACLHKEKKHPEIPNVNSIGLESILTDRLTTCINLFENTFNCTVAHATIKRDSKRLLYINVGVDYDSNKYTT